MDIDCTRSYSSVTDTHNKYDSVTLAHTHTHAYMAEVHAHVYYNYPHSENTQQHNISLQGSWKQ